MVDDPCSRCSEPAIVGVNSERLCESHLIEKFTEMRQARSHLQEIMNKDGHGEAEPHL